MLLVGLGSLILLSFPVRVSVVGICGSVLRGFEVGDIDFIIVIEESDDVCAVEEWKRFKDKLLFSNRLFWRLIVRLNEEGYRASMDLILDRYRDELIGYGFKDSWIDNWLRWLRVHDVREGVDRGLPFPFFDIEKVVERFIKSGWRGKRLDIQVFREKVPAEVVFIKIWDSKSDQVIVEKADLKRYYRAEYKNLCEVIDNLKKALVNNDFEAELNLPPAYSLMVRYSNMDNVLARKLRRYVLKKIEDFCKHAKLDDKLQMSINSILRQILKDIWISTLICDKLLNMGILDKVEQDGQIKYTQELFVSVYKRLRGYRLKKDQINRVMKEMFLS